MTELINQYIQSTHAIKYCCCYFVLVFVMDILCMYISGTSVYELVTQHPSLLVTCSPQHCILSPIITSQTADLALQKNTDFQTTPECSHSL